MRLAQFALCITDEHCRWWLLFSFFTSLSFPFRCCSFTGKFSGQVIGWHCWKKKWDRSWFLSGWWSSVHVKKEDVDAHLFFKSFVVVIYCSFPSTPTNLSCHGINTAITPCVIVIDSLKVELGRAIK